MNYPRLWKNKESGKKFRVMPWWETVKHGELEQVDEMGHMISMMAGRECKFGILTQVGFLVENEHGIWFGLCPSAVDQFNDLGEWKKPKKKKK